MKILKICVSVVWTIIYQLIITLFGLTKFSILDGSSRPRLDLTMWTLMVICWVLICFQSIVMFSAFISTLRNYLKYAPNYCPIYLSTEIGWSFLWNFGHPALLGLLVFSHNKNVFQDPKTERSLCAAMILMASLQCMVILSRIPKVGIQTLMLRRVFTSGIILALYALLQVLMGLFF